MTDEDNVAVVIKTGMEQLFAPLHDLLDKLLGPAATEVGLSLGDSAKMWRMKRQIRLLQELKAMIDVSGFEARPVPPRVFFPILEAASVEDDDTMQSRWSALLANAATIPDSVHPSYIEILKQLSPCDARVLDSLYDIRAKAPWADLRFVKLNEGFGHDSRLESYANLLRMGLIRASYQVGNGKSAVKLIGGHAQVMKQPELESHHTLSEIALKFVKVCRAPRKTEGG